MIRPFFHIFTKFFLFLNLGGDLSRITIQLYLHDVPEDFGGATTFIGPEKVLPCQPKCGSALIFTQNLLHEGSLLKKGIKY